jgi:hypothetical protein
MGLIDIYNIWSAEGGPLHCRFVAACLVAAKDVVEEAPETANHVNRLIWAGAVLNGDETTVRTKAKQVQRYAAASNATLQTVGEAATDNDVQYIVNSLIDTLATGG